MCLLLKLFNLRILYEEFLRLSCCICIIVCLRSVTDLDETGSPRATGDFVLFLCLTPNGLMVFGHQVCLPSCRARLTAEFGDCCRTRRRQCGQGYTMHISGVLFCLLYGYLYGESSYIHQTAAISVNVPFVLLWSYLLLVFFTHLFYEQMK